MDIRQIMGTPDEKPLENLISDGGFCPILGTIACIGDSLSSGELESLDSDGNMGWHDYYDYSWGQFMARTTGCKVYNFSKGGMSAPDYWENFADENGFWDEDKKCRAYIIALGWNDINSNGDNLGDISDIDANDYNNNKKTFAGYMGKIISKIKEIQPKARIFLETIPTISTHDAKRQAAENLHAKIIYDLADMFEFTYVLDFRKYQPVVDEFFIENFYLGGHLSFAGYALVSKLTISYIDYIIRHNMQDFKQIGFVGTDFHNVSAKW